MEFINVVIDDKEIEAPSNGEKDQFNSADVVKTSQLCLQLNLFLFP
jgi:hypothetical protein